MVGEGSWASADILWNGKMVKFSRDFVRTYFMVGLYLISSWYFGAIDFCSGKYKEQGTSADEGAATDLANKLTISFTMIPPWTEVNKSSEKH